MTQSENPSIFSKVRGSVQNGGNLNERKDLSDIPTAADKGYGDGDAGVALNGIRSYAEQA